MHHWRHREKVVGSSPLKKIKLWRWSKAILMIDAIGLGASWYAPLWEIPLA